MERLESIAAGLDPRGADHNHDNNDYHNDHNHYHNDHNDCLTFSDAERDQPAVRVSRERERAAGTLGPGVVGVQR